MQIKAGDSFKSIDLSDAFEPDISITNAHKIHVKLDHVEPHTIRVLEAVYYESKLSKA